VLLSAGEVRLLRAGAEERVLFARGNRRRPLRLPLIATTPFLRQQNWIDRNDTAAPSP
jgi:hypothetical protein